MRSSGTLNRISKKIVFHGKRADGIVKGMLQHSRAATAEKQSPTSTGWSRSTAAWRITAYVQRTLHSTAPLNGILLRICRTPGSFRAGHQPGHPQHRQQRLLRSR